MSPAHRQMDQSPPSRLGEGDPTRSLRSELLPAASGELSELSPPPSAGRQAGHGGLGRAGLGLAFRGGVRAPDPSLWCGSGRSAVLGGGQGFRAPRPSFCARGGETIGEGESRRAATPGRAGGRGRYVWGKFSSPAWRAHVYACAGLDLGRQAARGRWGWGWRWRGPFFSPSGRRSAWTPRSKDASALGGWSPSPDLGRQAWGFSSAPPPHPRDGWGVRDSTPSGLR